MEKTVQGLDFVNTQGIELTTLLDQASSVHFDRTPATDDKTVNTDTHINMSLDKYKEYVGS